MICSNEFPPGPGGIGTQAHQIALQLHRRGWEVLVATPQDYAGEAEIAAFNRAQPFSVLRLPGAASSMGRVISSWRCTSAKVKTWRPDVLAGTGDRALYLSTLLAARFSTPHAVIEHGRIADGWEGALKRACMRRADAVVCVSEYTRRRLIERSPDLRRLQVIHNGADPEKFRPLPDAIVNARRKRLGLVSARLLLTAGNVTRRKGQDVVIRALPHILKSVPDVHYLIAGLPTLRDEFSRVAEDLGVARHVHFLGRVEIDDLVELMNCCDLFVMTSRHSAGQFEGFGIAAIEAALCGKPAVVSANSGLAEAVVHGETGVTVLENDARSVATAIVSLLQDEARRSEYGRRARRRALEQATWDRVASQYDALLRSVAGVRTTVGPAQFKPAAE